MQKASKEAELFYLEPNWQVEEFSQELSDEDLEEPRIIGVNCEEAQASRSVFAELRSAFRNSISSGSIASGSGGHEGDVDGLESDTPHDTGCSEFASQYFDGALIQSLDSLARLAANASESFSVGIFLVNPLDDFTSKKERVLVPCGVHTLSRDFVYNAVLPFGRGLVGWVAENSEVISVAPFERDATTLAYYSRDQSLKSFIALPIIGKNGQLIGVLACDSKKSYGYSKITERILIRLFNSSCCNRRK